MHRRHGLDFAAEELARTRRAKVLRVILGAGGAVAFGLILAACVPGSGGSAAPGGTSGSGSTTTAGASGSTGSSGGGSNAGSTGTKPTPVNLPHPTALPFPNPAGRQKWYSKQLTENSPGEPASAYAQAYLNAQKQAKALGGASSHLKTSAGKLSAHLGGGWTALGPAPMGTVSGQQYSGRVSSMATDGTNLYVGAAGGGVWKSTLGSSSWTTNTDSQQSLAVGAVTVDPVSTSTIYAGTGEDDQSIDSFYGEGILKSTNGGSTWTMIGTGTFAGLHISSIVVDSNNDADMWVGTDNGLYYSSNATGATPFFTSIPVDGLSGGNVDHMVGYYNGADESLYVSLSNSGLYTTANATQASPTWSNITPVVGTGGSGSYGFGAITYVGSTEADMYLSVSNSASTLYGFYKSTNSGSSWTSVAVSGDYFSDSYCYGAGSGGQGFYDNAVATGTSSSFVAVAGECLLVSTNGGTSWTMYNSNDYYQAGGGHSDYHSLLFDGSDNLFAGNDGGVYELPYVASAYPTACPCGPGVGFTDLNGSGASGLNTIQFYPGATVDSSGDVVGGAQDNGNGYYTGSLPWAWLSGGGDGGFTAIDPLDPSCYYWESDISVGGSLLDSAGCTVAAPTVPAETMNWVAPMVAVANTAGTPTLYFGATHVWKSTNGGSTWTELTASYSGSQVSALAVAAADTNIVYAAWSNGTVQMSTDGGTTWHTISTSLGISNWITHLTVAPANPYGLYATYSGFTFPQSKTSTGHVVYASDTYTAGTFSPSWTDISGNLPNAPVNSIVVDGCNLIVGTDVGVFSAAGPAGTTWSAVGSGLPNTQVEDLTLSGSSLIAVTHGRGAWKTTVGSPTSVTGVTVSPSPDTVSSTATYTVTFTTSASGALPTGGTILLSLAPGTTLPTSTADYTISASSGSATVGSVEAVTVNGNPGVVIVLSPSSIGASSTVTLTISNVTNPASTSNSYTGTVATGCDASSTTSSTYSIVTTAPTQVVITPTSSSGAASASSNIGTFAVILENSGNIPTSSATPTVVTMNTTGPAGDYSWSWSTSASSCPLGTTLTSPYQVTVPAGSTTFYVCYGDKHGGTDTINPSAGGLTNNSAVVTIGPSQVVFSPTTISGVSSTTPNIGPITVTLEDLLGNATDPLSNTTVSLSTSSANGYFSTYSGTCSATVLSPAQVVIPTTASSAQLCYMDPYTGVDTITPSASGLANNTATVTINPSQVVISPTAASGAASTTANIGPFTLTLENALNGAANALSNTTITLNSSSVTGVWSKYSAGACQAGTITSIVINSGTSTAQVCYGDPAAGTDTVHPSGASMTNNSATVTIGASKVSFSPTTLSGMSSPTANLGPVTVQLTDALGNPVTPTSNVTVALNSSSGTGVFSTYSAGACQAGTITTVTLTPTNPTATVCYGDPKAGTDTISPSSAGLTNNSTTVTIGPSQVVFSPSSYSGPSSNTANIGIAFVLEDSLGNITGALSPGLNVTLTTSSATGVFSAYSAGSCVGASSHTVTVTVPTGANNFTECYGDPTGGSWVVTASSPPLAAGTATVKIGPAQVDFSPSAFAPFVADNLPTIGPIAVVLEDINGNPIDPFASTTVNLNSTSSGGLFWNSTSTTCSGTTTTSVTIPTTTSTAYVCYSDTLAGTHTINPSAATMSNNSVSVSVFANVPAQALFTSPTYFGPPSVSPTIGPITVQLYDQFGNITTASSNIVVNLGTSSGSGSFSLYSSSLSACELAKVTSVTIPAGSQFAQICYGNSVVSSDTITTSGSLVGNSAAVTVSYFALACNNSTWSGNLYHSPADSAPYTAAPTGQWFQETTTSSMVAGGHYAGQPAIIAYDAVTLSTAVSPATKLSITWASQMNSSLRLYASPDGTTWTYVGDATSSGMSMKSLVNNTRSRAYSLPASLDGRTTIYLQLYEIGQATSQNYAAVQSIDVTTGSTTDHLPLYGDPDVPGSAAVCTAPVVSSISPASGPDQGGTTVTISGTGFLGTYGVYFGLVPATSFIVNSAGQISAVAPPGTTTVDVRVETSQGASSTSASDQYTYAALSCPSPTWTGTLGGSVPGPSYPSGSWFSPSGYPAMAAASAAGQGSIVAVDQASLSTAMSASSTLTIYWESQMNSGATVSVSPDGIVWTELGSSTSAPVGDSKLFSYSSSYPSKTYTLPAAFAGLTTLYVRLSEIGTATSNNDSAVTAISVTTGATTDHLPLYGSNTCTPPTITSLNPTSGPGTGGTKVVITGTSLAGTYSVMFGTTPATSFTVVSDTEVDAVAPAGSGTVGVTLTTLAGTSGSLPYTYTSAGGMTTWYAAPAAIGAGSCADTADACTIATAVSDADTAGSGTIYLASGDYQNGSVLNVNASGPLAITAEAGATPLLDGQGSYEVLHICSSTPCGGTVTLTGVTVENGATGIRVDAPLVVKSSTFTGNAGAGGLGGAIENANSVTVSDSTFASNSASGVGAAIGNWSSASATISDSTFYNNTGGGSGGAVAGAGTVTVAASTFVSNATGDINNQSGSYAVTGSIMADTCAGTITDNGYNAATATSGCLAGGTGDVTDAALPGDLGALANNGGTTQTIKPNLTAPEVGTIPDPTAGLCPETDQTGKSSGTTSCTIGSLYVLPVPAVTAVSPSTGPQAGGTTVTITGTNLNGATIVDFGTNAGTIVTDTATSMTVTSPACTGTCTPGTPVDVTVTTPVGTSATSAADQFTYIPAPTVTSISPNVGPVAGGTTVTITGTNLSGATAVDFGTNPGTIVTDAATSMTVTSPACTGTCTPGTPVDVTVTTPGGTSATSAADHFTYEPVPTVTAISPTSGPAPGGTTVTITGTNLSGATAVDFGTNPGTIVTDAATSMTVTSPACTGTCTPGTPVDVTVTTPGGTSATSAADQFTYIGSGTLACGANGWSGTVGGGAPAIPDVQSAWFYNTTTGAMEAGYSGTATVVDNPILTTAVTSSTKLTIDWASQVNSTLSLYVSPDGVTWFKLGYAPSIGYGSNSNLSTFTSAYASSTFTLPSALYGLSSIYLELVEKGAATSYSYSAVTALSVTTSSTSDNIPLYGSDTCAAPTITSFSPTSGAPIGGNTVVVTGTNLTGAYQLYFGTDPVTTYTIVSSTEIDAAAAPGNNTAAISVTNLAGTATSASNYTYTYVPGALSCNPGSWTGSLDGTAPATEDIVGMWYSNPTTAAMEAGYTGTAVAYDQATLSTAVTSASTITINWASQMNSTLIAYASADGITWYQLGYAPSIGYASDTTLAEYASSSTSTFSLPAALLGSTNLYLEFSESGGATSTAYSAVRAISVTTGATTDQIPVYGANACTAPSVSSLSPTTGPAGTTVVITGTGLLSTYQVEFGTTPAATYTIVSSTEIDATAPSGTGAVAVTVTNLAGSASGGSYTY